VKLRTPLEQAERIAWLARFLARSFENSALPRAHHARAKRGLARALKALESPPWKLSTLQRTIVQLLESAAEHLAAGRISDKVAIRRASRSIDDFLAGHAEAVSATYRPRRAPRALVLRCLRAWPRKGGSGQGKRGSKYDALHALLVALGIKSSGPASLKQVLMRRPARTRKV
jgi:hypothetical protein